MRRIAVGVTSFDDCARLTWLLGWIGTQRPRRPPRRSLARFAMTSFTFMWMGVPAPAWKASSTAASGTVPSATRSAAQTMARAHLRGKRPSRAFASAAACLTRA